MIIHSSVGSIRIIRTFAFDRRERESRTAKQKNKIKQDGKIEKFFARSARE